MHVNSKPLSDGVASTSQELNAIARSEDSSALPSQIASQSGAGTNGVVQGFPLVTASSGDGERWRLSLGREERNSRASSSLAVLPRGPEEGAEALTGWWVVPEMIGRKTPGSKSSAWL